jgi:cytochrome c-type biogenesis protein CcmH
MNQWLKIAALLWALAAGAAQATLEEFDFTGPVGEQRFRELIGQLRCLVCQNESLAASQAALAQDLRQEVYKMMAQGQDDTQIVDFLVARYGDFVLYNPPVKPTTYPLWIGPFLLLAVAGFVLFRSVSRRARQPEDTLSPEQRRRVEAALNEGRSERDKG